MNILSVEKEFLQFSLAYDQTNVTSKNIRVQVFLGLQKIVSKDSLRESSWRSVGRNFAGIPKN